MSYMDRKNILEEGFFTKLINKLKKSKPKNKNKEAEKLYKDAIKHAEKASKIIDDLNKKYGIE